MRDFVREEFFRACILLAWLVVLGSVARGGLFW